MNLSQLQIKGYNFKIHILSRYNICKKEEWNHRNEQATRYYQKISRRAEKKNLKNVIVRIKYNNRWIKQQANIS